MEALSKQAVQKLWTLRNHGKISDASELYSVTCAQIGGESAIERLGLLQTQGTSFNLAMRFSLLEVSFLRNKLQFQLAKTLLAELEKQIPVGTSIPFELVAQKALNAFVSDDFVEAFELFLRARASADSLEDKAWLLYNQLLAMEEIGLETTQSLLELEQLLTRLSKDWSNYLGSKIPTLRIRKHFRSGNLNEITKISISEKLDDFSLYFTSWVNELPYVDKARRLTTTSAISEKYAKRGSRWLLGYRVRTLKGLFIELDRNPALPSGEQIERFYLWTWRWLVNPTVDGLQRIFAIRNCIVPSEAKSISEEHYQMLENATRWLGLLSQLPEEATHQTLRGYYSPSGQGSALLEYETLFLSYLRGLKRKDETLAKDTMTVIENHPLHTEAGLLISKALKALVETSKSPEMLSPLVEALRKIFFSPPQVLSSGHVVSKSEYRIRTFLKDECIGEISNVSLVKLLVYLKEQKTSPKKELLKACFGYSYYDPYVHDPKIANLLTLANRVFKGVLRFSTKGDDVSLRIIESRKIIIEGEPQHTELLKQLFAREDLWATEKKVSLIGKETEEHFSRDWVSRIEIERLLGLSKASVNRRLKDWADSDLVEKTGSGRNSKYKMHPKLIDQVKKEATVNV